MSRQIDILSLLERAEALADSGDLAGALAAASRAIEAATDPADRAAALLFGAELAALADDADTVAARLDAIDWDAVDDAELFARAGMLCLELGDPELGRELFLESSEIDPDYADAFHGLGVASEAMDDHRGMVEAFLRVRELDEAEAAPACAISLDDFTAIAEAAMAELPPDVIALLENVPILVDDAPSRDLVAEGNDPRVLGLFSGVPLPHKSHAGGQAPAVDSIHLFKRNLERLCDAEGVDPAEAAAELAEEIRITLLHETAHFFGLEDDDLGAIGLG